MPLHAPFGHLLILLMQINEKDLRGEFHNFSLLLPAATVLDIHTTGGYDRAGSASVNFICFSIL